MFAKIQSLLTSMFGADITTICCVFVIAYIIFKTIYAIKGRCKNDWYLYSYTKFYKYNDCYWF